MACMEWRCTRCGWFAMNNEHVTRCPQCFGDGLLSFSDEHYDEIEPEEVDYDADDDV